MKEQYKQKEMYRIMSIIGDEPLVLYGAGRYGKQALVNIRNYFPDANVKYFVDDDLNRNALKIEGIRVLSLSKVIEELGHDFYILITNYYVSEVLKKIEKYEIDSKHIYFCSEILIEDIDEKYILQNSDKMHKVYDFLSDYQSKMIYRTMIESRYTKNIDVLSRTCGETQYFPEADIFSIGQNEIFVDAGAFDGDTIEKFLEVTNNRYKYIYAFEPDAVNVERLRKKSLSEKIKIFNGGLYDETKCLNFLANKGYVSRIQPDGDEIVQVYRFDEVDVPDGAISFVKMDIEGSELKALEGMTHTIMKYKPKLAICIYHKFEDLWEIPLYIKKMVPEYRLYIRNYKTDLNEVVLYAVI